MIFKAVMFDLDGTLLDTLADIGRAANNVLAQFALPVHELERYRDFVGGGLAQLITRILPPAQRNAERIEAGMVAFREEYRREWQVSTKPFPGIAAMLDALTARQLKLAVLSNKPDDFTRLCVSRLLAAWDFAGVAGLHAGLPPKPDPTGALRLAAELEVEPADILYVGDSGLDMETAVRAGMYPAGALWGFRTEEELRRSGARFVAAEPGEIVGLIKA